MLAQVRGGGAGSRAWLPSPGGCHAENACGRCVTGFPEPGRPLTGMRCSPGRALCRGCIHTPTPAASPVRWRISLGTEAESPTAGIMGALVGAAGPPAAHARRCRLTIQRRWWSRDLLHGAVRTVAATSGKAAAVPTGAASVTSLRQPAGESAQRLRRPSTNTSTMRSAVGCQSTGPCE